MRDPSANKSPTIAIVGGGISGLTAAFEIQTKLPSAKVVLLESAPRLGGVLETAEIDGYLVEKSADMFTIEPGAALELCRRLDRANELIETIPVHDRAYVATESDVHPVPRGLSLMLPGNVSAIMGSPLLDGAAKARFAQEIDVPPRDWSTDESLESFAVRRFGQAVFDRLIQPLVSGIYTADPKKLSMRATMQRFVDMEREHGSLIAAAKHQQSEIRKTSASSVPLPTNADREASGARYGLFRAPTAGIGQLIGWLSAASTNVNLVTGATANSLSRSGNQWQIRYQSASHGNQMLAADAVVLATAASISGRLLAEVAASSIANCQLAKARQALESISAASSAIVVLGVDRSQLRRDFRGYGIIVPTVLKRNVIATSFASNKFAGRTPKGKVLIRGFVGGALQSELVDLEDRELIALVKSEIERTVGLTGQPEMAHVFRWRNCMPQYHLGHLDRVNEIESGIAKLPGLELAGNSYRGVGIPACIESGQAAASRVADYLNSH